MEYASSKVGLEWFLPPLAVSFDPGDGTPRPGQPLQHEPPNLHGATRLTCLLCGECNIGCNYGSKNTLDYNYLSRAKLDHGAQIRTRCEVKTFAPRDGGGFTVDYVDHEQAVEGEKRPRPLPADRVTCDRLVLAAGSFGTTFLLLKNRAAFPNLSRRVGTHSAATATCSRSASAHGETASRASSTPATARDHEHRPREGQGGGRAQPRVLRPGRRPPAARRLDRRDELPAGRDPARARVSASGWRRRCCASTTAATSAARSPRSSTPT
jgi:hypothetical protein